MKTAVIFNFLFYIVILDCLMCLCTQLPSSHWSVKSCGHGCDLFFYWVSQVGCCFFVYVGNDGHHEAYLHLSEVFLSKTLMKTLSKKDKRARHIEQHSVRIRSTNEIKNVPYLPCVFLLWWPYSTVARRICISCCETEGRAEKMMDRLLTQLEEEWDQHHAGIFLIHAIM